MQNTSSSVSVRSATYTSIQATTATLSTTITDRAGAAVETDARSVTWSAKAIEIEQRPSETITRRNAKHRWGY